jgi:hypothetical protein
LSASINNTNSESSGRAIWLFLHIPKCGGTTVRDILTRNFGQAFKSGTSLVDWPSFTADQTLDILQSFPEIQCFADHRLAIPSLPLGVAGLNPFTFVRDPFERLCSEYFHNRERVHYIPEARQLSLDDYLRWAVLDNHRPADTNYQCKWLSGGAGRDLSRVLTPVEIVRALNGRLYPLERLNEVLVLFQHQHPTLFQASAYLPLNATPRSERASAELEQEIRRVNQQDAELLHIANRLLDEQLAETFSEPGSLEAALATMTQRCLLLKKRNSSLVSKAQRKLWRLLHWADEALK